MGKQLGKVLVVPFKIQLWSGKAGEPDVMFMRAENDRRRFPQYWQDADLVMEVISPDDPERDTVLKKAEYAKAGIPEYWLIDPENKNLTLFVLDEGATTYREVGVFARGQAVQSVLLEGFQVEDSKVFAI